MAPNDGNVLIENATLLPGPFRNFSGREGMFNREGDRNFAVLLPPELAMQMLEDGWNVKQLKPREEGVAGDFYITVSVGFKNRPPVLVLISSHGRVDLSQHECEVLDWVDIRQADVILRPYRWEVSGKTGIKAYVKSLFITLEEDYLDQKYSDVPRISIAAKQNLKRIGSGQIPDEDIVDAELVDD